VTRGAGQVIAIIDSGVKADDPNLRGKVRPGWNFYFGDADTSSADHRVQMCTDLYGRLIGGICTGSHHGTDTALTAAGWADNEGPLIGPEARGEIGRWRVGVAPEAEIVPFVAFNSSHVAAALARAAEQGVKVANYSGGSSNGWVDPAHISAAAYFRSKGGLIVNAAGNATDSTPQSPAAEAAFLFVAATRGGYDLTYYSNRGPSIDLCAPEFEINGGGTSNAAPAVAAAAALVWAVDPGFTNVEVEQILKDAAAARPDRPAGTSECAAKTLDVGGAVRLAVERAVARGSADRFPPTVQFRADALPALDGVATVDVAAGDDRGLARVVLKLGGQVLGEDLTPPYQFVLDGAALRTQGIEAGTLTAEAVDLAGNRAETARPLALTVQPAPIVDGQAPTVALRDAKGRKSLAGRTVLAPRKFTATLQGADEAALDSLRVYVDGVELGTVAITGGDGQRRSARYTLDTRAVPNGRRLLKAVAMDGAGNVAEVAMTLKVKNPKAKKN
jgi:thermitase